MAAPTFETFSPIQPGPYTVYDIGATEAHPQGVAQEMAAAFGHELTPQPNTDNLGGLISKVGPAKELQANIAGVQEALGTDDDAVTIARGWAERSGLLVPVERLYATAERAEGAITLAVVTGGVRNWMSRRADRVATLAQARPLEGVLLAAGNRVMKPTEGPDVEEGMTEADYMHDVVAPQLGELGISTEVLRVDSGVGDEVMRAAVAKTSDLVGLGAERIAVVSNAGAWVQNGGQYRRAAMEVAQGFDVWNDQFEVISDGFPLGTGIEPTATHQNPFSAAGQIARNLREFTQHVHG